MCILHLLCRFMIKARVHKRCILRVSLGCQHLQSLRPSSAIIPQTLSSNLSVGQCDGFTTSHNQLLPSTATQWSSIDQIQTVSLLLVVQPVLV